MQDNQDVSPEVFRDLHALELHSARRRVLVHLAVLATAIAVWAIWDGGVRGLGVFIIAIIAVWTTVAIVSWRRLRGVDAGALSSASVIAEKTARAERRTRQSERFTSRPPYMTGTIGLLLIAVGVTQLFAARTVFQSMNIAGLVKPLVHEGEWWRVLSATFLHPSGLQLMGNLVFLLVVGWSVEAYASRLQLALVYLICAISGSLASVWLMPTTSTLGSSGAAIGVGAFFGMLAWRRTEASGIAPAAFLLGSLYIARGANGRFIDNVGYAGAAFAGVLLGLILVRREPRQDSALARAADALGVLALTVLIVAAASTSWKLMHAEPSISDPDNVPGGFDDVAPITSASFVTEGNTSVITNTSTKSIEAFVFEIGSPGQTASQQWRDDCCFSSSVHAHENPIVPGASRRVPLGGPGIRWRSGFHVALTAVLFDDGSFEGSLKARQWLTQQRRLVVAEASRWIQAIESALTRPDTSAQTWLSDQISRQLRAGSTAQQLGELVGLSELSMAATRVPEAFPRVARQTKSRLEEIRQELQKRIDQ